MDSRIRQSQPSAGPGISEALRRLHERAESTVLSADFEDKVMARIELTPRRRSGFAVLRGFRKVAAVWLLLCLMGGLSYAAFRVVKGRPNQTAAVDTLAPAPIVQQKVVRFAGQPLDSILTVVAAHYRRAVCFRDEAPRQLRLLISWDTGAPLADFVENLNELEGVHIADERDTLFVSYKEGEGDDNE